MFHSLQVFLLLLCIFAGTSFASSPAHATPTSGGAPREQASASDALTASVDRDSVQGDAVGGDDPSMELPLGFSLDTVMAEYSTRFRRYGRSRNRGRNVVRGAERLDGTIIAPGGTLSFNETVGARTRRNGFHRAMVIDGGELVPGMGGGVCQVASTLHAAALKAGLDIVHARPHSRPSSYIPMGLDATVSYPQLDLVLSNPFEFPVQVVASAEGGRMHVQLVGQSRPRDAEVQRRVLGRQPFGQRIIEDASLPAGTREVTQEGIRGARVEVTRTITDASTGEAHVESHVVRYPPTDEIVRVGTRSQLDALFALLTND